jgi:hypothetical protein
MVNGGLSCSVNAGLTPGTLKKARQNRGFAGLRIWIGGASRLLPPTPPYIRVRIRRFAELSANGLFRVRTRGSNRGLRRAGFGSLEMAPSGLHPFPPFREPVTWIFSRMASSRVPHSSIFPAFRPSAKLVPPNMPSADFSAAVTSLTTRSVRSPGRDGDLPR